ncbi:MAG TPA: hypothetical protein VG267_02325 [Terracidiphilus sp.]|nr:hypothetical protein [Terracidiphilus sp.]
MRVLVSIVLAVLAAACANECFGQQTSFPTRLGDECDLSILGATDTKGFLEFDTELRAALTKQDPVALAFLVRFPLDVNEAPGDSYSLNDAGALQRHFVQVFGAKVRQAVLNSPVRALMCRDEGVMYGNGEVWVEATKFGYAVSAVNVEAAAAATGAARPQIKYECQTEKHRIVIDEGADRAARYRSWDRPHSVTGDPDLVITRGDSTFQGTGVCAYPQWTFKNATVTYTVDGALGCLGDSEPPPPKGASGHLLVKVPGKPEVFQWCF